MIIYDFDKTLTYRDSLLGFYKECNPNVLIYTSKLLFYIPIILLYKMNLIDNCKLKKFGVLLFLKGKDKVFIKGKALKYSKIIPFNNVYKNNFSRGVEKKQDIIIISASFEIYIRPIFPNNVTVIGSKLAFDEHSKVNGLKDNLYGKRKLEVLSELYGHLKISKFYTDSKSDRFLAEFSKKTIVIKGDQEFIFNDYQSFLKYIS